MTTAASTSPRRPWSPDGNAHLIFQWVKMEGKTQTWVADAFGIDQSTVSRILQRYERWQAHAKERENGRLDHSERLRAQRWLTFERNELILASCLRIAGEMEGFTDVSKSTVLHPAGNFNKEHEVRTQHARIDRSGVAARFLRLAFRINMEQLKLAEHDPPPLPTPLSDEELAAEELQAAADQEELAAARRYWDGDQTREGEALTEPSAPDLVTRVPPGDALPRGSSLAERPTPQPLSGTAVKPGGPDLISPGLTLQTTGGVLELRLGASVTNPTASVAPSEPQREPAAPAAPLSPAPALTPSPTPPLNPEPQTLNPSLHNVHNLHTENPSQTAPTTNLPCTCAQQPGAEENSACPCITERDQPQCHAYEALKSDPLTSAATSG
jgi:transposase